MIHALVERWLISLPRLRDGAVNRAIIGSLFGGVHGCGFLIMGWFLLRFGMNPADIATYAPADAVLLAGGPVFAALLGMIFVGALAMTAGETRNMSSATNAGVAGIAGALVGGALAYLLWRLICELDRNEDIDGGWRLVLTVAVAGGTAAGIAWSCDRLFARASSARTRWYLWGAVILEAVLAFAMATRFLEVRYGSIHSHWLRLALALVVPGLIAGLAIGSGRLGFVAQSPYAVWLAPLAGFCVLALVFLLPKGEPSYEGKSVSYWQDRLVGNGPNEQARATEVLTEMLHDSHWFHRFRAAETLARHQVFLTDEVRAVLLESLEDPDPTVRRVTIDCLRRDPSPISRKALQRIEPTP
jgi:HEAT repeat protein